MKIDYSRGYEGVYKQLLDEQKRNDSNVLIVTKKCYNFLIKNGQVPGKYTDWSYKFDEGDLDLNFEAIKLEIVYNNSDSDQGYVFGQFYVKTR